MKSPSFRFYASDFLGSPTVQLMDACEVGAYILLLCNAWESERHGHLPDEDDKLRRWARLSREQWDHSRNLVLSKFPVVEEGWRANPRMVDEAEKQRLYSEAQRERGKQGGRGHKKEHQNEGFTNKSESLPVQSEGFEKESPVKPAVAVAVAGTKTNTIAGSESKSVQVESGCLVDGRLDTESIWELWPNKNSKKLGLQSIHSALCHLTSLGVANPVEDLTARVKTWLAWHARETAAGRFVPAIGYAQGWFGDRKRRYLDDAATPPAETVVLVNGKLVAQSECEKDGWVVVKGDV